MNDRARARAPSRRDHQAKAFSGGPTLKDAAMVDLNDPLGVKLASQRNRRARKKAGAEAPAVRHFSISG